MMVAPHVRELADAIRACPRHVTTDFTAGQHLDFEADRERYPYYAELCDLGGKDLKRNAQIRLALLDRAEHDDEFTSDLWEMCAHDILFYVNLFVWTYDPRLVELGQDPNLPFITYPCQDWLIGEFQDCMGKYDYNLEKSRDVGASWCALLVMDHTWRFDHRHTSFLLVSAKEDLVDWEGNPDTLFAKLDHIDNNLPWFLQPVRGIKRFGFHRENLDNNSVFNGAPSIANVAMGGRRTAILFDEFAAFPKGSDTASLGASQKATKCRIWLSTPKGGGTAQAGLRKLKGIRTRQLHWSDIPACAAGLYRGDGLGLELIDQRYHWPLNYDFKLDRKWRSPYFDREEGRCPIPWLLDQELNISYLAESRPFFDGPTLDRLVALCRQPDFQGEIEYERETLIPRSLTPLHNGRLKLWIPPTRPPPGRPFVIGIDVALGTAGQEASNSVGSIWDILAGRKIGEYVDNSATPDEFAEKMIVLGRWFGGGYGTKDGAKLIWEQNGPGNLFRKKIIGEAYGNIHFRPRNEDDVRLKITTLPGFNPSTRNKLAAFAEYRRALGAGEAVNYGRESLEEARCYRYMDSTNSGVEWGGKGADGVNRSDTGEAHGDRCTADVLGWKIVSESEGFRRLKTEGEDKVEQNPRSLGARHRERREREAALTADYY